MKRVYTIANAVDVCLPYDDDVEPVYANGEYTFTYPVTGDSVDDQGIYPNTIITYATIRPATTTGTVDYYRIPMNEVYKNTPLFYLKNADLNLDENILRVVLHAYLNGVETGHVEMLPVKRDTDGTYLFHADIYPMNELVDADNMIEIATRDYGGGNWIPTKTNTVANIDATKPEFRMSILFKSNSNPKRVSDIVVGDDFTGYIMNDQYYINNFSMVQELKEMRSVVEFGESSMPTGSQLSWYHTLMKQTRYLGDDNITLYQILDTIRTIISTKNFLTEGEAMVLARETELVKANIDKMINEIYLDNTILPYNSRVLFKEEWDNICTALDFLIANEYYNDDHTNEFLEYDGRTCVHCYVKKNGVWTDEEILIKAHELFLEDHPKYYDESDADYEARMEERWTERMQSIYSEDVKSSISVKDYSVLYSDYACTKVITPNVNAVYCIYEENSIPTTVKYVKTTNKSGEEELKQVTYTNIAIWNDLYHRINKFAEDVDYAFASRNVKGGMTIQLMPVVEYSLMNSDKFADFVKTFTQVHRAIEPVIFKRLEGNHYLDCKLVGTYGLSHAYVPDTLYGIKDAYWPNLSVQISFDVKLYNRALATNTINELRNIIRNYFNRLSVVHMPKRMITMENNLYISHIIQEMEANDNVAYLKFNGWYTNQRNVNSGYYMGPEVQAIVQKWARIEDMDYEELEQYVPEMFVLDEANIEINVIEDGVLA